MLEVDVLERAEVFEGCKRDEVYERLAELRIRRLDLQPFHGLVELGERGVSKRRKQRHFLP